MSLCVSFFSSVRKLRLRAASLCVFGVALSLQACVPPAEPKTEAPEPEPAPEGGIPWAPGEAPSSAESTTREVAREPKEQEPIAVYYEDDGVQEATSGPACSGKAPPALRALVDVRAQETKDCSAKIPIEKAGASGDMKVSVRVARKGEVESVEILADTLGIAEVTSCVKAVLGQPMTDARPRGGCTIFVLPLHFESAPGEESAPPEESDTADVAPE